MCEQCFRVLLYGHGLDCKLGVVAGHLMERRNFYGVSNGNVVV